MIGRDKYVTGVDYGRDDGTANTVFRTPGGIRIFLRKIGLDRSRWEYKIVSVSYEPPISISKIIGDDEKTPEPFKSNWKSFTAESPAVREYYRNELRAQQRKRAGI